MADLAEKYGHDPKLRISHEQNVILPHVHKSDLPVIWYAMLKKHGLATANIGLISDIIACPGMDYCALATARSIPIAQEIATRFDELKLEHDIGDLKIKISGCINACGHHHVGHIGILGLDRAGVENYQITLGWRRHRKRPRGATAPVRAFPMTDDPAGDRADRLYLPRSAQRCRGETFAQTYAPCWPRPVQGGALRCRTRPMPQNDLTTRVRALNERYRHHSAAFRFCIRRCKDPYAGKLALVSSFGAESVVLLHMVSVLKRDTPVIFIDTEMLFTETLVYQQEVAERLGLSDLRILHASQNSLQAQGSGGTDLHKTDPDACCALRKTRAAAGRACTVSMAGSPGANGFRATAARRLSFSSVEAGTRPDQGQPAGPLAPEDLILQTYIEENRLPRHPLVAKGYPSIGCMPCTSPVRPGEDPRAGRWRDTEKTECGIHFVARRQIDPKRS